MHMKWEEGKWKGKQKMNEMEENVLNLTFFVIKNFMGTEFQIWNG